MPEQEKGRLSTGCHPSPISLQGTAWGRASQLLLRGQTISNCKVPLALVGRFFDLLIAKELEPITDCNCRTGGQVPTLQSQSVQTPDLASVD